MLGPRARLIHTGQHTDEELSGVFLAAAGLPAPQTLSGICGEPRHRQVGRIIEQLGEEFARERPAAVLVQGDTNTAMAAAQAGSFAGLPVVHVEPGSARSTGPCPRRSTGASSAYSPTCTAHRPSARWPTSRLRACPPAGSC